MTARRRRIRADSAGQTLVEFALVIPLFLILLMALIEFGFMFNGLLSINYATRDAALIAAEAGNAGIDANGNDLADCVILQKIEQDVTAPANPSHINQVQVYWTNAAGQPLDTSGNVTTWGNANQATNVYGRTGSTTCRFPDGTALTIPYRQTKNGYSGSSRCNFVLGSAVGCRSGHPGLDTIGVQISYFDTWRTPLHTLIGLLGSGWTLGQSNQMRMEPVL